MRRCLERLVAQDLPRDSFEIIVVDDALSQSVPRLVAELAAGTDIPIVCVPGRSRGPATARNIGWQAARGKVIAFIDDDAYPAGDHWLAEGLRALDASGAAAVTGKVVVPADDPPTDFQRNVKRLEEATFLTCNAFVSRAVLEAVGGFDERFRVAFREDSDLQFRIEEVGAIERCHEAEVVHPAPRGRWGISLRLQRYSMYNALIYKKHPRRYAELQAAPPLHYYAMLLLAAAAMGAALFGEPLTSLFLLVGAAVLWLAFLGRRIAGTSKRASHLAEMVVTSLLIPPLAVYWRLRGAVAFRVLFV